jgi:hypothetical protein
MLNSQRVTTLIAKDSFPTGVRLKTTLGLVDSRSPGAPISGYLEAKTGAKP